MRRATLSTVMGLSSWSRFSWLFGAAGRDRPPTLTLPHKGGGDQTGAAFLWSPPPLWGRVRVGGAFRENRDQVLNPECTKPRKRQHLPGTPNDLPGTPSVGRGSPWSLDL